jgi:hypothetical protein
MPKTYAAAISSGQMGSFMFKIDVSNLHPLLPATNKATQIRTPEPITNNSTNSCVVDILSSNHECRADMYFYDYRFEEREEEHEGRVYTRDGFFDSVKSVD